MESKLAAESGGATPPVAEDESNEPEMPLTMAASVVLTSLPKNTHEALEGAGELPQAKGTDPAMIHLFSHTEMNMIS